MTRLPLLRRIERLAPDREIRTILDASAAYFTRREPMKLEVTITFRDEDGARYGRPAACALTGARAVLARRSASPTSAETAPATKTAP